MATLKKKETAERDRSAVIQPTLCICPETTPIGVARERNVEPQAANSACISCTEITPSLSM